VIKDRQNVPLGGHSIVLTATAGAVAGSPALTDRYGTATFMYTAPADTSIAKQAYLTATDNDPRGGISKAQKISIVAPVKGQFGNNNPALVTRVSFDGD
jgi:hypothetical protein